MDKDVKPYKQRGDTCAIVCLMMTLEYYGKISKANWYDERRLYRIYGSKYIAGTPFAAIAYNLSKKGLNVSIYHSEKKLFKNDKNIFNENDFKLVLNEYKEYLNAAMSLGTEVFNNINITCDFLKEILNEDNLIILAGEILGIFHAILITGYIDNRFIVCDPLYKNKQERSIDEINTFMDTSIGKWFICVNNK